MTIRVGNAPVSWGVFEADRPNPPFSSVLDAIAATGYEGTELGPYGYLPTDPEVLGRELDRRNLSLASSFVPLALEDDARREEHVRTVLAVGRLLRSRGVHEVIIAGDEKPWRTAIAGRVPKDGSAGLDEVGWQRTARSVAALSRALASELGMRIVLHHHAGTYFETEAEIERFLAETDPELVGLLLDTGHAVYGGVDPVTLLRHHARRVRYVHLKDADRGQLTRVRETTISMDDAWRAGVFCPLGQGVVDFPKVLELLRAHRYSGWVIVEQDVVPDASGKLEPDPTESARESRRFLREKLGL